MKDKDQPSLRSRVYEFLRKNPNRPMHNSFIAAEMGHEDVKRVSGALYGLKTDRGTGVSSPKQGVHVYDPADDIRTPNTIQDAIDYTEKNARATMEEAARVGVKPVEECSHDEPVDERFDENMYFTQAGIAENGDLIITRDSDTKVYRATPL